MQFILGLVSILFAEVVRDIYHIAGHYWQPIKQYHLLHHKAYRKDFSIANPLSAKPGGNALGLKYVDQAMKNLNGTWQFTNMESAGATLGATLGATVTLIFPKIHQPDFGGLSMELGAEAAPPMRCWPESNAARLTNFTE